MNGVLDRRKNSPLHKSEVSTEDPESEQDFILRKKIQIKTQALMMLSQELDQCRMQRDRFKLMAEQLQEDLNRMKQESENKIANVPKRVVTNITHLSNEYRLPSTYNQAQKRTKINSLEEDKRLMDLLIEAKEENKCLRLQVDTMRHQLNETQADIKALRSRKPDNSKPEVTFTVEQREELLEQMEKLNVKCVQLKLDLQSVIDIKQEVEMERDAFKCKAHRLNHELSQALSASKPVDVDALVNENRYLQERLQQLLEEKELTQQSVQKYKSMLDSKRQKGTIKLGGKSAVGSIMNLKQVEQLLQQGPNIPPQKSAAALAELHSICTALLESLNDKNTALAHQKKVNKMLATRMCELDKAVQSPSSRLLEGYTNADVDIKCDSISMTSDISEERSESKSSDLQIEQSSVEQDIKAKPTKESHIVPNTENSDATSNIINKTESHLPESNCPESSVTPEYKERICDESLVDPELKENIFTESSENLDSKEGTCSESFANPDLKESNRSESSANPDLTESACPKSSANPDLKENTCPTCSRKSEFKCNISEGYKTPSYVSDEMEFNFMELEKEINSELPEDLRILVQRHLDELREQDKKFSQGKA